MFTRYYVQTFAFFRRFVTRDRIRWRFCHDKVTKAWGIQGAVSVWAKAINPSLSVKMVRKTWAGSGTLFTECLPQRVSLPSLHSFVLLQLNIIHPSLSYIFTIFRGSHWKERFKAISNHNKSQCCVMVRDQWRTNKTPQKSLNTETLNANTSETVLL